ncbi:hypothetical protein Leryth_002334 [Lithospermum erythrorhizon]|nr:hypothetical protein Leryth_002334 [Lithospermum erythrorhizon]
MMPTRGESKKKIGENSGGEKLLNDIEAISKSLYPARGHQNGSSSSAFSRSKSIGKAPLPESRSKLKEVHSVEGLPPFFDDLTLVVRWKRRDEELVTRPMTVINGVAEFEDYLTHSLFFSGTPELDLGKHRMDLTRILPLTLEELEEEKSSGKWTTSFKLSGKGKGAVLNVSFGYMVIGNNLSVHSSDKNVTDVKNSRQNSESVLKSQRLNSHCKDGSGLRRVESLPVSNVGPFRRGTPLPFNGVTRRVCQLEPGHTQAVTPIPGHCLGVVSVAVHPSGRIAASASIDSFIRVFDVVTNNTVATLEAPPSQVWQLNFNPQGTTLAVAGGSSTAIKLWDTAQWQLIGTLSVPRPEGLKPSEKSNSKKFVLSVALELRSLVYSPVDARVLFSASDDGHVHVYDAEGKTLITSMSGHASWVLSVDVTPDGQAIASGSSDKSVRLWDLKMRTATQILNNHTDQVWAVAFGPPGRTDVHSVEGLPPFFDDLTLVVRWKRRDEELVTRPMTVINGVAEFEDYLTHSCSVYGSRSGPHHSAKYEAKHFLLVEEEKSSGKWTTSFKLSGKGKGAVLNNSESVLKSQPSSSRSEEEIKDLHEILPTSISELSESVRVLYQKLDEERVSDSVEGLKSGTFKSSDAGEEDKLNHGEFEFSIMGQEVEPSSQEPVKLEDGMATITQCTNTASPKSETDHTTIDMENSENNPSVDDSGKPQQDEVVVSDNNSETFETPTAELQLKDLESAGDSVPGIAMDETSSQCIETRHLAIDTHQDIPKVDDAQGHPFVYDSGKRQQDEIGGSCYDSVTVEKSAKELLLEDLESALHCASGLETEGIDLQEGEHLNEDLEEVKSNYSGIDDEISLSLDDVALDDVDSVANEFLNMLGIEDSPSGMSSNSDPESPRERLLRQFERDTLADGFSLFDSDMDSIQAEFEYNISAYSDWRFSGELDRPSLVGESEVMDSMGTVPTRSVSKASELEGLENEALMHEWGLNERAFQSSPPQSRSGFGSPIFLHPEDPHELPPLGEGLGPFIQTRSGGFLRSMNPSFFKNAKNEGNLVMQVSSPVVMPAEMGSGVMEIMQHLASIGIEKLSVQANKLMPLDEITGKTMQQIAWEGLGRLDEPERQDHMLLEAELEHNIFVQGNRMEERSSKPRSSQAKARSVQGMDAEYVSLEDLAPLAMEKIEALSVEGLRVQSGMSDEDAPSNITPQSIGEFSALEGKRVNGGSVGLEGTGGLKLLDIKGNNDDVDGLIGLSLTLDEWMKLDAGEFDDEDDISERTSRILAAHHANSLQMFSAKSQGEKRRGKGRKGGLLGNNFTVALMVQLRDPLRNYELVGTPMLALIQVERVFVPPKPKIYNTMSEIVHSNEEEDEPKISKKEEVTEEIREEKLPEKEQIPQYKITEVHCAGFKTEPTKKKLWGSPAQQQSGSRWLLANGMGKKNKHPLMKSKALPNAKSSPADSKSVSGDTLWSISSRVRGIGATSKTSIRNPNIILPK